MQHRIYLLTIAALFFSSIVVAKDDVTVSPWTWNGSVKVEDIYNFNGGSRRGSVFDGAAKGVYDTEAAKLWSGGQFTLGFLGFAQTHNQTLYTGAIQSPSNLSANNNEVRPYVSYQHKFSNITTARAGIIDLNDYFNVTEAAAGLLNASFGISPGLTVNNPTATYPYPGCGAMVELDGDKIGAQVGLFQGNPQHLYTVSHNGYMLIGEINAHIMPLLTLKGGAWRYTQSNKSIGQPLSGMYIIAEALWDSTNAAEQKGMFLQFSSSQKSVSIVPNSFGVGFIVGQLSAGMTQVYVKGAAHEKIYEITYAIPIVDKLTLNPDLQYVVKPGGVYSNAIVGILRLTYAF